MALNDITIYNEGTFGFPGSTNFATATATATAIKAGEPVAKALAGTVVTALATSKPVVGTDYLAGIAATSSTETATVTGTVQVTKITDGVSYLIAPKVASAWTPQSAYDALVGARVTFDLTTGTYTINSTDAIGNGLVVEPLEIAKYPGKVRFSIRNGVNYLA